MVTMQRNASKKAVSTEKKLNSGMDQRGNQLREEFSRQFLHGMSDRIQSDFGPKQLFRTKITLNAVRHPMEELP